MAEDDGPGNQGSGLSLSISRRIVTLYGGAIAAHNSETGGLVDVIEQKKRASMSLSKMWTYFPPVALIALRICASAASLQYLQFNCRNTEV